jgi:hypothetical protein
MSSSSPSVVPKSSASRDNNDSAAAAAASAVDDCRSVGFDYDRLEHDEGTFQFRDEFTGHGGVFLETAQKGGFKIQPRCVQRVKTGIAITDYDECVSPHTTTPYLIIEPHEELNIANVPLRPGEEIVLEIENPHNEDVDYPGHRVVGEVVLVGKFRASRRNAGSSSRPSTQ